MDTLKSKEVEARNNYKCDLCGGEIKQGEIYRHSTFVDDGIYSFREHSHCHYLSHKLKMYDKVNMCEQGLDSELFEVIVTEDFKDFFPEEKLSVSDMAFKLYKKLGE